MEDAGIKALVIGVSLFVTMLTVTAIVMYYNTAMSVSEEITNRVDIAASYDYIMKSDDFSDTLTGVEVRSLINKYANIHYVKINVEVVQQSGVIVYQNVNNKTIASDGWLVKLNDKAYVISEEKLNIINPAWNCRVDKVETLSETTLTIRLNVKD